MGKVKQGSGDDSKLMVIEIGKGQYENFIKDI